MSSRAAASALLLLAAGLHAEEPQRLVVTQARARLPAIVTYLDVLDEAGLPADLQVTELQATLGGATARIEELEPFEESGEGVAYIFLVDVSHSLSEAEFAQIREALGAWTAELLPKDRVALLSFGDDVQLELDYTADGAAFGAKVAGLGPRARGTMLYAALQRALELGRREDLELPERRVLVVLSDGQDEGSGLSEEDTLRQLQEEHLPLYAIGYSRLAEPERKRALDVLQRLASDSGGVYKEAAGESLAQIYAALKQAIRRVYRARFGCGECRAEGPTARLQVSVSSGSRVLTDGLDLRLLPPRATAVPSPRPKPPPTPTPPPSLLSRALLVVPAALGLLVLVGLAFLLLRNRRPAPAAHREPLQTPPARRPSPGPRAPAVLPSGPRPVLLGLSGEFAGAELELDEQSLAIGSDPRLCQLVFPPDNELVSKRHCTLHWVAAARQLMLEDCWSTNGTFVGAGQALQPGQPRPLTSGERFYLGDKSVMFEVRFE